VFLAGDNIEILIATAGEQEVEVTTAAAISGAPTATCMSA
jgi:hypothetical protein